MYEGPLKNYLAVQWLDRNENDSPEEQSLRNPEVAVFIWYKVEMSHNDV